MRILFKREREMKKRVSILKSFYSKVLKDSKKLKDLFCLQARKAHYYWIKYQV